MTIFSLFKEVLIYQDHNLAYSQSDKLIPHNMRLSISTYACEVLVFNHKTRAGL